MLNRRQFARLAPLVPAARLTGGALQASGTWTAEWDRAVLEAALARQDAAYDPAERMLRRRVGPQYQYHTNLRSTVAHPTRDSLEYALLLLEAGDDAGRRKAGEVLDRVLGLQDTDPGSKWYGIWGWYMEEPPPRMSPADWNWADFNGSTLLLIEFRHGRTLPEKLRLRIHDAIRHAGYSVRRRNVSMGYTNIAVKGTFVTLAAAELLKLEDLRAYAEERMLRLARHIDQTGSFDEYNSPTYARVALANLTRMLMYFRSMEMKEMAGRIHERAWLHLARHWHAPTRQLAGPMSRCYRTDIGSPLWLQKALGGRLEFSSLADIRAGRSEADGEVAMLDWKCPETVAGPFLALDGPRQHREIVGVAVEPAPAVHATTWLEPALSLGSINLGDFWVQRRPLLAYWGGPERPARYLQLRLIKDDYDFASGLFSSVQEKGCVLALANFRSPGGDRHVSLEPVKDGAFECRRLRLRADLAGVAEGAAILVDGKPAKIPAADLPPRARVAVDLGGAYLWLRFPMARFGKTEPKLSLAREEGLLTVSLDFHRSEMPAVVRWSEVAEAWAALSLVVGPARDTLDDFSRECAMGSVEARQGENVVRIIWTSPAGRLWLDGATAIGPVERQRSRYQAGIGSGPVPYERLSDERLATG